MYILWTHVPHAVFQASTNEWGRLKFIQLARFPEKKKKTARKQDQHEQHPNQEEVNTVFESITHKDTQTKASFWI